MAKKCKECGASFDAFNSMDKFCSVDCQIDWLNSDAGKIAMQKAADRIAADKERAAKRRTQQLKKGDKRHQIGLTQKAFNKMRVLEEKLWFKERGLEPECISCGKTNMDWCCGHFKTTGSSSSLRFNRSNTFLQCNYRCNMNLSGNINGNATTRGFKQGLFDRFGEEEAQKILDYLDRKQSHPARFTCDQLIVMRKEFNQQIRELEDALQSK